MYGKAKLFGAIVASVTLAVGIAIGHQLTPTKEQVRKALYEACVNGHSYKPDSDNRDGGFNCNRRSIDSTMAAIYGDSYIEPLPDAEARAKYESTLAKYKRQ